ncbi:hypothetical protein AB835_03605 [Candidatus Endobugula sertula]|uniref:DUF4034 domain-containing protein n=1 Tax=Candidatus Endobugula sertula TaxID=62101 RepID=A0A1D2QS40_9GAMM|nr:hypothetical protein AB835_03605 [Candidatus Endobugula sertula]
MKFRYFLYVIILVCAAVYVYLNPNVYSKPESVSSIESFDHHPPSLYESKIRHLAELKQWLNANQFSQVDDFLSKITLDALNPWDRKGTLHFYLDYLKSDKETFSNKDVHLATQWVNATGSVYAYSYRSLVNYRLGWQARGTKFFAETPTYSIHQMRKYFKMAIRDAEHSLTIQSNNGMAWVILIDIKRNVESKQEVKAIFHNAIQSAPEYFPIYRTYLSFLQPKWSRYSWEAMFDFAQFYAREKGGYFNALITKGHRFKAATLAGSRSRLPKPIDDRTHDNKAYNKYYREYFMLDKNWSRYQKAFELLIADTPDYVREVYHFTRLAVQTKRKELANQYLNQLVTMGVAALELDELRHIAWLLKKYHYDEFAIVFL